MTEPEFLEPDVVLFVHDQALREYGGVQGLKDEGLLHSALGRPVNKLAYADREVSLSREGQPSAGTGTRSASSAFQHGPSLLHMAVKERRRLASIDKALS